MSYAPIFCTKKMEIRSYLYMQNSKQDASKESLCGLSTTMQGGIMIPCCNKTNCTNYI